MKLKTARHFQSAARWVVDRSDRFVLWIVAMTFAEITTVGILRALYMPLWLDEIMGVLIAKLPHSSDIWAICKSGADNQPPLYHYLMRASVRVFGNDALGMRLPSLAGYVVFCICLYWFVSRRTSRLYGAIAMLFPALTRSWYYATEGRPYAVMLACTGLAAVCWQSIIMQQRRVLMLIGLSLSLACAQNVHYYAVLLLAPFWIAESVRTSRLGKVDAALWLALTAPLLVLVIYLPVIQASRLNSGIPNAFFSKPSLSASFWIFAEEFLDRSLVALICVGVLYFAVQIFGPPPTDEFAQNNVARRYELIPEASLILGFTCLPIFAIGLSRFGTHIFFPRYAIAGVFGIAALLACSTWLGFGGKKGPALVLVCALVVLIVHDQRQEDFPLVLAGRATPASVNVRNRIPKLAQGDGLPIIVTNADDFMRFVYYADPILQSRVFYVSSESLAKQYLGFTFLERMMIGSAPYFGTQVIDYATFVRGHRSFYVFGPLQPAEWVVPKLMADDVELHLVQGGPKDTFGNFADICLRAEIGTK